MGDSPKVYKTVFLTEAIPDDSQEAGEDTTDLILPPPSSMLWGHHSKSLGQAYLAENKEDAQGPPATAMSSSIL